MRTIGRTSVPNLIKFDNLAREFCQLANNILLTGKDPSVNMQIAFRPPSFRREDKLSVYM